MNRIRPKIGFLALILLVFLASPFSYAADFPKDLSISAADVRVPDTVLKGQAVKIYATVHNNSKLDLAGVVKYYDEKASQFIGSDQPVSALAGKTDDVFVDWNSEVVGDHPIAIRVIPWNTEGDNPDNNKVVKSIYVDVDTDGDGKGDRVDPDDDNDGVLDTQDAFFLDPKESKDTDHDGIGDNADPDDDNDGASDIQDAFPQDPTEFKDADGDSYGDSKDFFPLDPKEWLDNDHDGTGDNSDPNNNNHSPIPQIQVPQTEVNVGQTITFNGLKSSDPDDTISRYEWDFGDQSKTTGVVVDHVFKSSGKYLVTLKATDSRGESKEQQILMTVKMGWVLPALIAVTVLLIILLMGLFIPGSRFHHKKMRLDWAKDEGAKGKKK